MILTILSVSLGQLGKIPGLPEGVGIYLTDILILATVLWWLAYSLAVKRSLKIPRFGFLILAFAFVALISLINGARYLESVPEFIVSSSYWLRWVIYAGVFFVASGFKRSKTHPVGGSDWIEETLIVSGVLLAVAGFVQLIFFPDWSQFTYLGWDPHKNRLLSTFFDPNFTGIYLVLVINLLISRLFRESPPRRSDSLILNSTVSHLRGVKRVLQRENLLGLSGLVVCSTALVLTFSRSAWLAMAVSILVWGIFKSHKLLLGALLVAFLAYFAVPRIQTRIMGGVDPDDSARLRFASWQNTLVIAKEYPVLGVGFNAFRFAQEREGFFDWRQPQGGHAGAGSDSSLLLVFATTGVVGLLVYLTLLGKIGLNFVFLAISHEPAAIGTLAILSALLVDSLFINSLFYPAIMLFFWLTISSETAP